MRIVILILLLCIPTSSSAQLISETYKKRSNLFLALIITTYYTMMDYNQQNSNIAEWDYDAVALFNIAWRTALFGVCNYYESSYIPDNQKTLSKEEIAHMQLLISRTSSAAGMITYNSRYEKVIINRFDPSLPLTSIASILIRNVAWFYTVPRLLKPVNNMVFAHLPPTVIAEHVYAHLPIRFIPETTFFLVSLFSQNMVMSIKHTLFQFLPSPEQPFRLFPFTMPPFNDCTLCYLGTNLFGKNGPLSDEI